MKREDRYRIVLDYFRRTMPSAQTELNYDGSYQLLIAVMLSAQCTDKRINKITPALFLKYPSVSALAKAEFDDVLELISSVSYPNSKARHIIDTSKIITEKYNSEIPDTMNQLLTLPGVGRKTANVILSIIFGKATMAVDTHVYRVSHRLRLVPRTANTPAKVEKILTANIPSNDMHLAHHWLLLHGRYVCTSKKPHCKQCGLSGICPEYDYDIS